MFTVLGFVQVLWTAKAFTFFATMMSTLVMHVIKTSTVAFFVFTATTIIAVHILTDEMLFSRL